VPNNNFGSPVGTTEAGRVGAFLMASAARKLKRLMGRQKRDNSNSVATVGSWPNHTKVALNSGEMRDWFHDIPRRHGEVLLTYLDPTRRNWSFEQYATQDIFQLYRLITVDLWLRQPQHSEASRSDCHGGSFAFGVTEQSPISTRGAV
jgi:hypothetical protein